MSPEYWSGSDKHTRDVAAELTLLSEPPVCERRWPGDLDSDSTSEVAGPKSEVASKAVSLASQCLHPSLEILIVVKVEVELSATIR